MRKIFTTLLLAVASLVFVKAQSNVLQPATVKTPIAEVAALDLPQLDNDALLKAELALRAPGRAPHFAENMAVDVSPATHGSWEDLGHGQLLWRLRVPSAGAKSLNLGFDEFFI